MQVTRASRISSAYEWARLPRELFVAIFYTAPLQARTTTASTCAVRIVRAWSMTNLPVMSAPAEFNFNHLPSDVRERAIAHLFSLARELGVDLTPPQTVANEPNGTYSLGAVEICAASRQVTRDGQTILMTPKEFDLLLTIVRANGAALSYSYLNEQVWNNTLPDASRSIATHIAVLRRKLEKNSKRPELIRTVRGVGYRLGIAVPGQTMRMVR